jgi:hypothetical protein
MTGHPEHAIRCPWCQAAPGTRCTTPRGRRLPIPSHNARIQTWTAQQQPEDET